MLTINKRVAIAILLGFGVLLPTGSIAAERGLVFAVAGVVQEIIVAAGQKVGRGDPLIRLDDRVFSACAKAGQARVTAAHTALEKAKKTYSDTEMLYEALSVSAAELQDAKIVFKQAAADVAEAESRAVHCAWRLEHSVLRAPAPGTVVSVPGYIGMVVNPQVRLTPVVVLRTQ